MNKLQNVYPIYLVDEHENGEGIETSAPFMTADPDFRGKSIALKPDDHRSSFKAYTKGVDYVLRLQYESVPSELNGEVTLIFSHRMRQNNIVFNRARRNPLLRIIPL